LREDGAPVGQRPRRHLGYTRAMGLIEAPQEAANLARDVVYDLERGYESQIASGIVPRQAVRDARATFRARVAPALHAAFEAALSCSSLAGEVEGAAPAAAGARGVAGVPPSSRIALKGRGKVIGALVMLGFFAVIVVWTIAKVPDPVVLARVALAQTSGSGEASLAVAGPAEVKIAVAADSVSWNGRTCLEIDAQALKGGAVVARMSCCGWSPRGRGAGGAGHAFPIYAQRTGCVLKVPAGGMERLRVATRLGAGGTLKFEGLEIRAEQ
jgi:hypothetical protein